MQDQLEHAIYRTVHEYRNGRHRGAAALAMMVGANAGTLANKANPAMETHQLGLRESIPVQRIAGDFRILHTYAAALGHVAVPESGDYADCSDIELLDVYAKWHADLGAKCAAIRAALADGRMTRAEYRAIREASDQAARTRMELLGRLEALIDDPEADDGAPY